MFSYFGYGSNMNKNSLRLKGVCPIFSERAKLFGWNLVFDLKTFFQYEGGMGNIRPSQDPNDAIHGVLHTFHDDVIPILDQMEGGGYAYKRVEVEVQTYDCQKRKADVYVALPTRLMEEDGLPSERYRNILIRGATESGLDPAYIKMLRQIPTHPKPQFPPFEFPKTPATPFNIESLKAHPLYTALAGGVFDMTGMTEEQPFLKFLFGGKDATLFFLRRMDSSDGEETIDDFVQNRLSPAQRKSLNEYLHQFNTVFRYIGRFDYQC